jgi:ribonuclease BN (tRNA processing enzyme)
MKLIVVNSNSTGNAYALDSGTEILLLEAGCKMADVKRAINFRLQNVVGCCVSHCHGDHAKYATEYAKFGVKVYGNEDVAEKKSFPYGTYSTMVTDKSYHIGSFTVVPFSNHHDVPIFGYLIHHKDMGSLLFSTDSYKIGIALTGVSHFLIEANYSDEFLKQAVWDGKITKAQSDRIMLSHMSIENCVKYLRDCQAEKSRNIILCHLSSRHSDAKQFGDAVSGAFGVPCYIAQKGLVVELNKELI